MVYEANHTVCVPRHVTVLGRNYDYFCLKQFRKVFDQLFFVCIFRILRKDSVRNNCSARAKQNISSVKVDIREYRLKSIQSTHFSHVRTRIFPFLIAFQIRRLVAELY